MDKVEMRERLRQVIEQYAKSPSWTPRQELRQGLFWKSIRAEFIGSFLLMIFSTSSDIYIGPVSYGCMVAVLTYALKSSSVYFNPVITLAAVLLRSITPFRFISLSLAQAIGTLSGATVVSLGLSGNESSIVSPALTMNPAKGFGYEFFATLVIILTISSQLETPASEPMFPIMSGIAVGSASAFARTATGGHMNPLRAFSLALFQNTNWYTHYIYWLGPILGSLLAVFTHDFIRPTRNTSRQKELNKGSHLSIITKADEEVTQQDTEFTLATLS